MTNELLVDQLDRRLDELKSTSIRQLQKTNWIQTIRKTLGMTLGNLSKEVGLSVSTVAQMEQREKKGKVTLETLQKTAEAMDCELVYYFVPKKSMGSFIQERAVEKAQRIVDKVDLHMSLEDQKVNTDLDQKIRRVAKKLIEQGKVW